MDNLAGPTLGCLSALSATPPPSSPKDGLVRDSLVAHAMAQFSHECGNERTMTENIRYSPERAVVVWPSRFLSADDCGAKVGCSGEDPAFPTKLIDLVYGSRNSNRPGTATVPTSTSSGASAANPAGL